MNKFTGAFREAVQTVYNGLGGHAAFQKWAKSNLTEYYRICSKLIPLEIKGGVNDLNISVHVHREPIPQETVTVLPAAPLPLPDKPESEDGS